MIKLQRMRNDKLKLVFQRNLLYALCYALIKRGMGGRNVTIFYSNEEIKKNKVMYIMYNFLLQRFSNVFSKSFSNVYFFKDDNKTSTNNFYIKKFFCSILNFEF